MNSLQTATNTAMDYSQAMIDGDFGKAEGMIGSLQANAVSANKIKDALLKKLNNHLVSQGKKPIDIDAEAKKQMDLMAASFAKQGIDMSKGASGTSAINSASVSAAPALSPSTEKENIPEVAKEVVPETVKIESENVLEGVVDSGSDPDASAAESQTATLDESLHQFEASENDISKDTGVSIFKQVSNRYLLNYTKLFNRKKIDSPSAEPEPAK
jgi:hypothetical protein